MRRVDWRIAILALIGAVLVAGAFHIGYRSEAAQITNRAEATARSRVQAIEGVLATQRAVTAILSDDSLARSALRYPIISNTDQLSRKLEQLRRETGSTVIYVLDRNGMAIAASNWDQPASFVGQNYGFREYFTGAMANGTARQFALGSVSRRPGLYLSHRVDEGSDILGVVVVKMEFEAQENTWASSGEAIHVYDSTGTVVLSSDPAAQFAPLPATKGGITVAAPVSGGTGWTLRLGTSDRPAQQVGFAIAGSVMLAQALLVGFALRARRIRRRDAEKAERDARYRADLERSVAERTRDLTAEMAERQAAEARLARMQADLVQANKLATLGQVAAGIAHEVNQPLATIRLLAENGQALMPTDPDSARDNLGRIVVMSEKIGQITTHLRGFARKATGDSTAVVMRDVIAASVLLTASRRRAAGAEVTVTGNPDLTVRAEAVRLEQILVNLIQNAQDALAGQPDPRIVLDVAAQGDAVQVTVTDNGIGISAETAERLFTPFATSKPDGLGLGLVIARDIARDLGGELTLTDPQPAKGAAFSLRLVRA